MGKTFKLPEFGYEVEIGKIARQADGAVWFKQGGTVILATAVSAATDDFPGFLPLSVDYRENFSAAGKIPGGYYKREGRSSDQEVLTSRLIDRAIRPLFPADYFKKLQIVATVYSVDGEHTPNVVALLAASLALTISKIPFIGPVGVVELGRVDGKWVVNPVYQDSKKSDGRIVIAGTQEGICMVEGSVNEVSESECIDLLFMAHEKIKIQVAWQKEIQQALQVENETDYTKHDWNDWRSRVDAFLTPERVQGTYISDKVARGEYISKIREEFVAEIADHIEEVKTPAKLINYIFDQQLKKQLTELILQKQSRVDGRSFEKVRDIAVEVGLLPFTHGSALFTRGRTQALVSVTLGSGQDAQRLENIMEKEEQNSSFLLHYSFPPFSVGDVRPLRGPGRREVGHGYLARSAINYMMPDKKDFPYTVRIVADMMESDGSTSMATACGSTMALMHAGVPLRKMVSGIAMGLLRSKDGQFKVLSDISGFEDAFGLMDFKVVGTQDGVTAIQMDIKYKGGLSREIFEQALAQSREGRLHILGEMQKCMNQPNEELSELVPKMVTVVVEKDKIGAIIGSGGKTIREIIETTGVASIDIEDDGLVKIFGSAGSQMDKAISWVKTLAGQIAPNAQYTGKIRRIVDFGLFVELVPGQDGLVHVSNIPRDKQRDFMREYAVDDVVTVEVVAYDSETGRIRLRLLEDNK